MGLNSVGMSNPMPRRFLQDEHPATLAAGISAISPAGARECVGNTLDIDTGVHPDGQVDDRLGEQAGDGCGTNVRHRCGAVRECLSHERGWQRANPQPLISGSYQEDIPVLDAQARASEIDVHVADGIAGCRRERLPYQLVLERNCMQRGPSRSR